MSKVIKMTREEIDAESLRLSILIAEASNEGLKAVEEMSKNPLSLEQKRAQVSKHQQMMMRGWTRTPIPSNDRKAVE